MNKFLILSFAVMGALFWELSGGADFEPPQRPTADARPDTARDRAADRPTVQHATPVLTRRNPERPAPAPVAGPRTERASLPETPAGDTPADGPATFGSERLAMTFGQRGLPPADPRNPGMLVSLEQSRTQFATPLATFDPNAIPEDEPAPEQVRAPAPIESSTPDLREISGTRVNMRDGPGTIYPVVSRLRLGQPVEVLSNSGTGWLRVRTSPDQTLGWVAASLVSKPDR